MFKAGIIAFAICVGAGGTVLWLKIGVGAKSEGPDLTGMPSIQELHDKAHLKALPVQEVREPF